METQKNKQNKYKASIISVVIMLLLLVVAVVCHLFGWKDAPFQFLAACLGAGVTVIITNLLLVEQTRQQATLQDKQYQAQEDLQNQAKKMELRQIKETEQYKTKLRIYQEYLEKLYEAVKDRELTTEEKIQMQFQTAYLAMHTETAHIEQVSTSVKDIIGCLIAPSSDKYDVKQLQQALFNIVLQFREELYDDEKVNDSNYEKIMKNFVEAFTPEGDESEDEHASLNNGVWQEATNNWIKDDKWRLNIDGETIRLHRPEDTEIHVQFGFWRGHYYIQAKYHRFINFSQELKWKYKGSKTYETWWKHVDEFKDLKEGEFWQTFSNSDFMQKLLVDWFEKLIAFIEKWDVPASRYTELMKQIDKNVYEQHGWGFWIYDSCCVVCDSNNSEEGKPFIDTFLDEEIGKVVVRLGNRANSRETQKKILERIGISADRIRETDNRTDYAMFEADSSNEVIMAKVAELMQKLKE